jgi:hypothetical protein
LLFPLQDPLILAGSHETQGQRSVHYNMFSGLRTQVGCGVGNTTFPLAASNSSATILSCDYSATAVNILCKSPNFKPSQMRAFVADATKDDLTEHVTPGSVDVVTCIFALSANALESLPKVRLSRNQKMDACFVLGTALHICCAAAAAAAAVMPFSCCSVPALNFRASSLLQ